MSELSCSIHPVASIFCEALLVEKILSFTHVCDWIKNQPPLINQVFYNVFNSEHFAKSYLVHSLLNLNDEQVKLLEERVENFKPIVSTISFDEIGYGDEEFDPCQIGQQSNTSPNYSSMQAVFKEYVDCSLLPKIKLKNLVSQYSIECDDNITDSMLSRLGDEHKALSLRLKIFEEVFTEYYDCDLIITDNGQRYEINNVSRFWKGGPLKQLFIKSITPIREKFNHEQGGFNIETVIFMGFGYPLNISFRGDYVVQIDYAYFKEEVSNGENQLFYAETSYHLSTYETTYSIMNNFLCVKQDDIPKELKVNKVYNTLLYHWFSPFLLGKSKMKDEFREKLQESDFDQPAIYLDSFMKTNEECGKKRKASESTTKSKKSKF